MFVGLCDITCCIRTLVAEHLETLKIPNLPVIWLSRLWRRNEIHGSFLNPYLSLFRFDENKFFACLQISWYFHWFFLIFVHGFNVKNFHPVITIDFIFYKKNKIFYGMKASKYCWYGICFKNFIIIQSPCNVVFFEIVNFSRGHINKLIKFSNRTIPFSSMCIRLLDHLMRRTEVDAIIIISVIKYKTVNTRQIIGCIWFFGCIYFSFYSRHLTKFTRE